MPHTLQPTLVERTVLIVEDSKHMNHQIQKRLEQEGFHTKQAFSGAAALTSVLADPQIVMLLDYVLPDMNGKQLINMLTAQYYDVPFIIMTGKGDERVAVEMMKLGARDYLIKHVDFLNMLAQVVKKVCHELATEQRLRDAEQLQRESEQRFRDILEHARIIALMLDPTGAIIYCNDYLLTLTRWQRAEIMGRNWFELFLPADQQAAKQAEFEQNIANETIAPHDEHEILTKHGARRAIAWNMLIMRDVLGHLISVNYIGDDITERKQGEGKLLQLRKAVETMQLGVTITDLERKILYSNPADAVMHGYTVTELLGQDARIFAPIELRQMLTLQQIEAMQGRVRESVNIRKDGARFPVQLISDIVRDANGHAFAIVTTCEDITTRKHAEETLQHALNELEFRVSERTAELSAANELLQEEIEERERIGQELQCAKELAEAANHAKSKFLANMSHELRTPLNAILGYAQIIGNADNLTAAQRAQVYTIVRSGQHLLTLINDILDLAKIEAGRMELQSSEVFLPEFLKNITDMIEIQAQQKGLAFVCHIDPVVPVGVSVDERRLREILLNLLGNAMKFTERGSVRFQVTRLESLAGTPNDRVRLRFQVEDTGIGITWGKLEEIFAPFQQVGEQRYRIEGSGLGLAISRELVKLMGGELEVESIFGKGSLFWFELDLPTIAGFIAPGDHLERRIRGYQGRQRTILIVDDQAANRGVLREILAPLGFQISEASSGHACLQQASAALPDAILLDLRMPHLDGFEVSRQLRQMPHLQQVVIIAISASVLSENQQHSLDAGCNDFLGKPFRMQDLLTMLARHLQLTWVYGEIAHAPVEEGAPSLDIPGLIAALPPQLRQRLYLHAQRGNVKMVLAELEALKQTRPDDLPLISELERFAKHFDIDRIVAMLETT